MKQLLTFIVLCSFSHIVYGQKPSLPLQSSWQFNLSYGTSIPIGKFKNSSTESFWTEMNGVPFLLGYIKEDNGFAQVGYNLNMEVSRKLNSRFFIGLSGTYQRQALNEEPMETVLNFVGISGKVNVEHVPYESTQLIPFISYLIYNKPIQVTLKLGYGWSQLEYPYYFFEASNPSFFGHTVRLEEISSGMLLLGTEVKIPVSSKWSAVGKIDFVSSNYSYFNFTNSAPGGSSPREFEDEVSLRSVNINLGLSYSLNLKN